MNKEQFWSIIDKSYNDDHEIMYENLSNELSKYSREDNRKFDGYRNVYSDYLEEKEWFKILYLILNNSISTDGITYFSLGLVARGKDFYHKFIENPDRESKYIKPEFGDHFEAFWNVGLNFAYDKNEDNDEIGEEQSKYYDICKNDIGKLEEYVETKDLKTVNDCVKYIQEYFPDLMKSHSLNEFKKNCKRYFK
jgi:hypothetical protein